MPLRELGGPPAFMAPEEQETTPTTFAGHAPLLRIQLDNVRCIFRTALPPWMAATTTDAGAASGPVTDTALNGASEASASASTAGGPQAVIGTLWVTDDAICFLSSSASPLSPLSSSKHGFTLDYPSLSLHAVSRSLPAGLSTESDTTRGCMYCQVDNSATGDGRESDEDDEAEFVEFWLLPEEERALDPLFESLSYCASLHPSATGDDGGTGNPFASMGPFGTGLLGRGSGTDDADDGIYDSEALVAEGAFDDAEEPSDASRRNTEGRNGHPQLSGNGRATLDRLDSIVQWPGSEMNASLSELGKDTKGAFPQERGQPINSEQDVQRTSVAPTNTLILVHVPQEVFQHTELAGALLDLLHAYGPLASWTPLSSFGRAIIVYQEIEGATRAKSALDRILLPLVDEGEEEGDIVDEEGVLPRKGGQTESNAALLRAYYGESTHLRADEADGDAHLHVPMTDRNFLISPPGSPPVGWEPIKEDPPNTNTLADDLMRALGSLRDKGLGVRGHEPVNRSTLGKSASPAEGNLPGESRPAPSPPSMLIPPRYAATRSTHPLSRQAYDPDEDHHAMQGVPAISLPGVSVQSVDPDGDDDDDADATLGRRMNKELSISSVKATVESMRGAPRFDDGVPKGQEHGASSGAKITPTARPPLG